MSRLVLVTLGLGALSACLIQGDGDLVNETPCSRYAEYVCVCHADDPDFAGECESLTLLADDPTSSVLNQCETDLRALRNEDEANGLICEV